MSASTDRLTLDLEARIQELHADLAAAEERADRAEEELRLLLTCGRRLESTAETNVAGGGGWGDAHSVFVACQPEPWQCFREALRSSAAFLASLDAPEEALDDAETEARTRTFTFAELCDSVKDLIDPEAVAAARRMLPPPTLPDETPGGGE